MPWVPDPLPMSGQSFEEPPEELGAPVDPDAPFDVPDDEPEFPELPLDVDGVLVEEGEVVLDPLPELGVVLEVVAAFATSAPPATRPPASAPTATMLRSLILIDSLSFRMPIEGRVTKGCALELWSSSTLHRCPVRVALQRDDVSQVVVRRSWASC